jgi:chemotaxis protein methyltransferase CheR
VLVLDKDLRVMAANEPFYRTFQVEKKDTEHKIVYELGNGQWNIPSLRQLLEDILPKNTFFKGFEVNHDFLHIGPKSMILNARQIHFKDEAHLERCPEIILLAIEDVTDLMVVAETIAKHTTLMEAEILGRTDRLEKEITTLKKEISGLKRTKKK